MSAQWPSQVPVLCECLGQHGMCAHRDKFGCNRSPGAVASTVGVCLFQGQVVGQKAWQALWLGAGSLSSFPLDPAASSGLQGGYCASRHHGSFPVGKKEGPKAFPSEVLLFYVGGAASLGASSAERGPRATSGWKRGCGGDFRWTFDTPRSRKGLGTGRAVGWKAPCCGTWGPGCRVSMDTAQPAPASFPPMSSGSVWSCWEQAQRPARRLAGGGRGACTLCVRPASPRMRGGGAASGGGSGGDSARRGRCTRAEVSSSFPRSRHPSPGLLRSEADLGSHGALRSPDSQGCGVEGPCSHRSPGGSASWAPGSREAEGARRLRSSPRRQRLPLLDESVGFLREDSGALCFARTGSQGGWLLCEAFP